MRNSLPQLFVAHGAKGKATASQAVSVPPMRAGDVIHQRQGAASPDGSTFLPDRNVRRPAVVEPRDRLVSASAQLHDHLFHLANHEHVFEEIDCGCGVDSPGRQFALKVAMEAKGANLAAIDFKGSEIRPRIAEMSWRHFRSLHGLPFRLRAHNLYIAFAQFF